MNHVMNICHLELANPKKKGTCNWVALGCV